SSASPISFWRSKASRRGATPLPSRPRPRPRPSPIRRRPTARPAAPPARTEIGRPSSARQTTPPRRHGGHGGSEHQILRTASLRVNLLTNIISRSLCSPCLRGEIPIESPEETHAHCARDQEFHPH